MPGGVACPSWLEIGQGGVRFTVINVPEGAGFSIGVGDCENLSEIFERQIGQSFEDFLDIIEQYYIDQGLVYTRNGNEFTVIGDIPEGLTCADSPVLLLCVDSQEVDVDFEFACCE